MSEIKTIKRQSNFELFRIVSMLMIVTLHYLGKGGLLKESVEGGFTYYFSWLLESLSFVAVNCYILLTCYFTKSKQIKLSKMLSLWLKVLLISVVGYFIAIKLGVIDLTFKDLFQAVTPITSKSYWYVTCFFMYLVFSPFLVWITERINQKQHKLVCIAFVVVFSVLPTIFFVIDWAIINKGYSFLLFIMLHFIGSYIRKYDSFNKKPIVYFALYFILSVLDMGYVFLTRYISNTYFETKGFEFHRADYNAIFVVLASIMLFLCFKNINIKVGFVNRIILFLSPVTIDVYLIHENPAYRDELWKNLVAPMEHTGFPDLLINFVIGVGGVYLACTAIGIVINFAFKILHINELCQLIEKKVFSIVNKIADKK